MSELTVEMILSLVDTASPKLKVFRDALNTLQDAAKSANGTLTGTQEALDAAAPSFERVASATKLLGSSTRTTARAMLGINSRLSEFVDIARRSLTSINELNAAMGRLSSTTKELSDSLDVTRSSARKTSTAFNSTFRSLNRLAGAADTNSAALGRLREVLGGIAPEASAIADASVAAATSIDAVAASAKRASAGVNGLHQEMKGLLAIYAGWKVEEGLKAGINQAISMQQATGQIRLLNLSPANTQTQINQANQLPAQFPYLTPAEAMKIRGDAYAAVTTVNHSLIDSTIGSAIKVAHVMRTFGDTNNFSDIVRNLYGVAEATGRTANSGDIISAFQQVLKTYEGTHGKISARDMETIFRNTKEGEGLSMSQQARYLQLSFAEQLKSSGHGGGGGAGVAMAGTAVTMLGKLAQGLRMNRMAFDMLVGAGLAHANALKPGGSTTYADLKSGALVDSKAAILDPLQWAHDAGGKVLAYTQKHWQDYFSSQAQSVGTSSSDVTAQNEAINRFWAQVSSVYGGVNFGNMMTMAENTKEWTRLKGGAETMAHSSNIEQANKISEHLLASKLLNLKASMETLANTIGTDLAPQVSGLVTKLTSFFQAVNKTALEFPTLTKYAGDAAAALGVLGVAWGALELLGKVHSLVKFMSALGKIGGTAATVSKDASSLGTALVETGGKVGGLVSKFGGLIGILGDLAATVGVVMTAINTSPTAKGIPGQTYTPDHPIIWPNGKPPIEFQLNNPGGIRTWGDMPTVKAGNNGSFVKFPTALAGLQALADNLRAYGNKHGRDTLGTIIPPWNGHGANTPEYIKGMQAWTGYGANQKLNMNDPKVIQKLMFGIIMSEIGQNPYSTSLLTQASLPHASSVPGLTAEEQSSRNLQTRAKLAIGSLPSHTPNIVDSKNVSAPYVAAIANATRAVVQQDKILNAQYKQGKISLQNYYADKRQLLTTGINQEIAILQKEATAFAGNPNMVNATLAKIAGRRQALVNGLKLIDTQQEQQEAKLALSLSRQKDLVDKQYAQLTGNAGSPSAMEAHYRALSGSLLAGGDPEAARKALAVGDLSATKMQYTSGMKQYGLLQGSLHNTITGNAALVQTGAMTKMQAAQANITAQQKAAPAMASLLTTLIAMEKASAGYAHNLGNQKIVAALEAQLTKVKAMGDQLGYYGAKVKSIGQNAMTGLFENMMHGQKTWGQMFGEFFSSIGKSLEDTLAKSLSAAIANALFTKKTTSGLSSIFSIFDGGGKSSGGSILGGLGSAIGSLFGGGSSSNPLSGAAIMPASAFSGGGGGSSWLSSAGGILKGITSIAGLFGFASGADNIPNDMVANIHKGEMIIPASGANMIRSGQATLGGAGGGNHLHMTIHAMDSQNVISALHNVREEAAQMFLNTASSLNLGGN